MQCLDSNSQLMENESPPITTRPELSPKLTFLILTSLGFTHCLAPFGHKEQRTLQRRSPVVLAYKSREYESKFVLCFWTNFGLLLLLRRNTSLME